MSFLKPKTVAPPTPAVRADSSVFNAGNQATAGMGTLITTGAQGLKRKASTSKPTLIGGS